MKQIIGLTVAEARKYYKNIRIVEENGARLVVTRDYRLNRLNVAVRDGKIVEVLGMG